MVGPVRTAYATVTGAPPVGQPEKKKVRLALHDGSELPEDCLRIIARQSYSPYEIVLVDTLQLVDLDFSELQASLESILMALRSHYETLLHYRTP